jgi:hypothetical protein
LDTIVTIKVFYWRFSIQGPDTGNGKEHFELGHVAGQTACRKYYFLGVSGEYAVVILGVTLNIFELTCGIPS